MLEELKQRAEAGDAEAQHELGCMYGNGKSVTQDYKEAVKWFTKAAEQGYLRSQLNIGLMYTRGNGVPQDHEEAIKWFTKAADQGYVEAQLELVCMYIKGHGTKKESEEALKCLIKSAEQGLAEAQYKLGIIYYKGQGITQDYNEAIKWFTKAAKQGKENAANYLALTLLKQIEADLLKTPEQRKADIANMSSEEASNVPLKIILLNQLAKTAKLRKAISPDNDPKVEQDYEEYCKHCGCKIVRSVCGKGCKLTNTCLDCHNEIQHNIMKNANINIIGGGHNIPSGSGTKDWTDCFNDMDADFWEDYFAEVEFPKD